MSEAPICHPDYGVEELSTSRANLQAAISLLGDARTQLGATFPAAWQGTGANTFTAAVLGLLHHLQGIDRNLRAADHTIARMDAAVAAAKASGTI